MLFLPLLIHAQATQGQNPFLPPRASVQYAPDRTCDLTHVAIDLDIDYPNKLFKGTSVNSLTPLRNGITEVRLMAGPILTISKVTLDGQPVKYRREGRSLFVQTPKLTKGKPIQIAVAYSAKDSKAQPFGGAGGFHWILPRDGGPKTRVGFWTQGETEYNSDWAPTWDYPNDLATSETRTTVQADWNVIANGVLVSDKVVGKRRTFHWKMGQPHATYLLSVVGGPLDLKKDKWEGVDLWYAVPRGDGKYIDDTVGNTKDMLSFFSKKLGVKYPYPKYAQNFMYDFGGGMENVTTTTMGEGSVTEARAGYFNADSLISHELAHQWFGDLVTCKDWGDIWLNESFATFMETLYMEHSRGASVYQHEIQDNTQAYLNEARRYKRPLSTKLYPNADAVFDSHAYPKGGVILHSLRRELGDEAFFAGLNYYLRKWKFTPVESSQLRRAFIEATGINVEPFWAQWIEKPGHPVLDYSWTQEGGKTLVTVKQTQDTSAGTPIYTMKTSVGVVQNGVFRRVPVTLSKAEETLEIPVNGAIQALLLDPDQNYLREIPNPKWADSELPYIVRFAPNANDRSNALRRMLAESPSEEVIKVAVDAVRSDKGKFPAFRSISPLAALEKPELRSFFLDMLNHESFGRRAEAVQALGRLPQDPATTQKLRSLIDPKAPIPVVLGVIQVLSNWDKKGNEDVLKKAMTIPSRGDRVKRAAERALG